MKNNKDKNKFIPMIISKFTFIDMENQIEAAEKGTQEQCNLKKSIEKDFEEYKNKMKETLKSKDKEISKLEKDLSEKNLLLESTISKKLENSKKNKELEKELADIKRNVKIQVGTAKGGFTKEINKLHTIIKAKDETIKTYTNQIEQLKIEINELKEKNQNQQDKIKEMSSNIKHISEEYQNDGLPQPTKRALKTRIDSKQNCSSNIEAAIQKNTLRRKGFKK